MSKGKNKKKATMSTTPSTGKTSLSSSRPVDDSFGEAQRIAMESQQASSSNAPSGGDAPATNVPSKSGATLRPSTRPPPPPAATTLAAPGPALAPSSIPAATTSNAVYNKIQTLPDHLRIFLAHILNRRSLQYSTDSMLVSWRILIQTQSRARATKNLSSLKSFISTSIHSSCHIYYLRLLSPWIPTDELNNNPTSRKTARAQLRDVILNAKPAHNVPKASSNDALLVLYKALVNDSRIPNPPEFIKPPNIVPRNQVKDLQIEELMMTLQVHAPHVYIYPIQQTHAVLVNIYIKELLDEELDDETLLVQGFHYALFRDSP